MYDFCCNCRSVKVEFGIMQNSKKVDVVTRYIDVKDCVDKTLIFYLVKC